ncbi:TetR/AcrR family transcriptional regulator [Amnibacterium kyonggiense]|uniref:TetR/AcrR family transcriptional regulator n=1 Tax=Amnibacterium kyonggiense TaxID=595671 RepID=UPI001FEC293E|nr:TetR/AcrR family transcriptional regulator [Amnibacterium kyonggiense]
MEPVHDAEQLPVGARVRRPRPGTAERRRRVLDSATEIFATKGYTNGSLLEIAEHAGISQAGVVHHFGSKDQLLVAMLEYRDDADVAELEGSHIPDGAALFDHLVHTVELNTQRRGIVQLYAVLSADSVTEGHPAQQYFRGRFVGLREMVASALRDVVPDADAHAVDTAASAIIGVMDGLQVQWLLDERSVDMPVAVRMVIDAVIQGLRTAAAS